MFSFGLFTTALAAISSASPLESRFADSYTFYTGNGSANAGWPATSAWASFNQMWAANFPLIQQACANNAGFANNSPAETEAIQDAISSVSGETGVNQHFILAIIMQEFKGCVHIRTTVSPDGSVTNPGLIQSYNGSNSCFNQTLAQANSATSDGGSCMFYTGARIYNSGSANFANLDDRKGATPCYTSDVDNRFTGWTLAPSQCHA